MQITPIGSIIAGLAVALAIACPLGLWGLLIFCVPLQASAVVLTGGDGLAPAYFVMVAILASELLLAIRERQYRVPVGLLRVYSPLMLFVLWSVFGGFVWPTALAGQIDVLSYEDHIWRPLQVSTSNSRHSLYLVTCAFAAMLLSLSIARYPKGFSQRLVTCYVGASILACAMILYHACHLYLGVPFPKEFIYNNPSVAQNQWGFIAPETGEIADVFRPSGTFSEPSFAACYVTGFLGFALAGYAQVSPPRAALLWVVLVCLVLAGIGSTTGLIAGAGLVAVLGFKALSLLLSRQRPALFGRFLKLAAGLALCAGLAVAVAPGLRDVVPTAGQYLLVRKLASSSGQSRLQTEIDSLRVFIRSASLGVGLGSHVSSTLVGYVLCNTGLTGAILILWFSGRVYGLIRQARAAVPIADPRSRDIRSLSGAMAGLVFAGLIGIPLLLAPMAWVPLGMLIGAAWRVAADRAIA